MRLLREDEYNPWSGVESYAGLPTIVFVCSDYEEYVNMASKIFKYHGYEVVRSYQSPPTTWLVMITHGGGFCAGESPDCFIHPPISTDYLCPMCRDYSHTS